jgi:1-phosphatidylinositol phosphodiesterase
VQDFCELSLKTDMDNKIAYAKAHLECERDPTLLYLNFLSASNFWRPLRYWSYSVASKMNPCITEHLRQGDLRCSGVVVCDWVGWKGNWDLVHCIIEMNAALLEKDAST